MAECEQQQHQAHRDGRLNAAIIELSGGAVDAQLRALAAFERHAKGSITKQTAGGDPSGDPDRQPNQQSQSAASAAWTSHAFLAPGAPPGAVCDAALEECDTESAWWCADGDEAESIATRLRQFAVRQFALVERAVHGRLLTVWEGIAERDRADLRWHFICTVRRDHAPGGAGPTHADTFDGCMVAFALAANKIQTPIYPAAHFDPPAVQQFVSAASGHDPTCRPDRIQLARAADGSERCGPQRRPRDAVVLILPGAVAHAIPARSRLHEEGALDSRGEPLAEAADNRWFCRVSIELIAGGVSQSGARDGGAWEQWRRPWPSILLRQHVALLTAEHVWGDPVFAEHARLLMP